MPKRAFSTGRDGRSSDTGTCRENPTSRISRQVPTMSPVSAQPRSSSGLSVSQERIGDHLVERPWHADVVGSSRDLSASSVASTSHSDGTSGAVVLPAALIVRCGEQCSKVCAGGGEESRRRHGHAVLPDAVDKGLAPGLGEARGARPSYRLGHREGSMLRRHLIAHHSLFPRQPGGSIVAQSPHQGAAGRPARKSASRRNGGFSPSAAPDRGHRAAYRPAIARDASPRRSALSRRVDGRKADGPGVFAV